MEERAKAKAAPAHHHVVCVECSRASDHFWRGWLADRIDEPETDDEPKLAFWCPDCAEREFGRPRRR